MVERKDADDWIGGLGYLWADRSSFYKPVAPCAFRYSEIAALEQIPASPKYGDVPIVRVVLRGSGLIWIATHLQRIEPPDLSKVAGVHGGETDPFRVRVDVVDDVPGGARPAGVDDPRPRPRLPRGSR